MCALGVLIFTSISTIFLLDFGELFRQCGKKKNHFNTMYIHCILILGSSHSSPNPYNQQSPAQVGVSNSPQYSGNTSPMTRTNTWHGKDQRYGRQNSDNSYNMRQSPRDGDRHNYGSNQSPRDNDMLPAQGQFHDSNAQNMDPLSMQIRREKILQQQRTTLDTHRQRNYPPQNPYGNRPPWQQHQRSYNRRY